MGPSQIKSIYIYIKDIINLNSFLFLFFIKLPYNYFILKIIYPIIV